MIFLIISGSGNELMFRLKYLSISGFLSRLKIRILAIFGYCYFDDYMDQSQQNYSFKEFF